VKNNKRRKKYNIWGRRDKRNTYKILFEKSEGKNSVGSPRLR
jgi:hypothetical protein